MTDAHLLLIEDNPSFSAVLVHLLSHAGYHLSCAFNGVTGLVMAREQPFDLILLDLGLPDFDGGDVVPRLRATSRVPILCLTARDSVEEKVRLLTLGADDYLVKPVHPDELLARVAAHLRRTVQRGEVLEVGALRASLAERVVSYQGTPLALSMTEFALLMTLMRVGGRVVGREGLQRAVWGGEADLSVNVVDTHLSNLRSKLRAVGAYSVLRTVRGVGYALRSGPDGD